jgi:hypothetical protein
MTEEEVQKARVLDPQKMLVPLSLVVGAAIIGYTVAQASARVDARLSAVDARLTGIEASQQETRRAAERYITIDKMRVFALQLKVANGERIIVPEIGD